MTFQTRVTNLCYLLTSTSSESSMFVAKNRIIIKTCGSTTLLRCVEPLLYLVKQVAGFDQVVDIFYSRKNFMRPELQDDLHRTFENEVDVLDNLFEGLHK